MWIFNKAGFFAPVEHKDKPGTIMVRARVKSDLDRLREMYMPTLSEANEHLTFDFPYRAYISREDFAEGMAKAALDLTYTSFKGSVKQWFGEFRHQVYTRIWLNTFDMETVPRPDDSVWTNPVTPTRSWNKGGRGKGKNGRRGWADVFREGR